MSEAPLANADSARSPTGEIKDQGNSGLDKTQETTTTSTEAPKDQSTATSSTTTEDKLAPKDGETLLTEGEDKTPKAEGAPEKYADFKLPEGIKLDGEQLTAATALFKESGLSQDAAQKMVDFHIAELKRAVEAPTKAYEDMRADWQAKSKADPAIGPKMAEVKTNVAKLYNAVGDAKLVGEFKELINLTGVGDNPAFIKVLNKLSEFVVEGKSVTGSGPSPHGQTNSGTAQRPDTAHAMYPNLT